MISPEDYRDEMINLLRWRLERVLGYQLTARIPMRMPNGMPIYDMLFATDHPLGDTIMTHLYRRAAEREPQMRQDAKAHTKRQKEDLAGIQGLFEIAPAAIPVNNWWRPESGVNGRAWFPASWSG